MLPPCVVISVKRKMSLIIHRQVFLARRQDKDKQFYAIKVVKKTDVVNKNMIEQGTDGLVILLF